MIIVTGAAGFIGSALIWELNNRGVQDILAVDWLDTTSKWKNFYGLRFSEYVDRDDFLKLIEHSDKKCSRVEGVIHLGACSSTTEADARFLMNNNYEYTRKLAMWCQAHNKRFIYASSAATYGSGAQGFSDYHAVLQKLRPLNAYGYSKHAFDLWALQEGLLKSIVGLKYFNVFGPNEYHKQDMRSMALKAFYQIRDQKKIQLFKSHRPEYHDGQQQRDFVYVKDAVRMTLFFWDNKEICGIYNIASGVASTWNALAGAVFSALKQKPYIEYIDMPPTIRDQYQYYTCADISKLRAAGYASPVTVLDAAVSDYVSAYLVPGERHLGE